MLFALCPGWEKNAPKLQQNSICLPPEAGFVILDWEIGFKMWTLLFCPSVRSQLIFRGMSLLPVWVSSAEELFSEGQFHAWYVVMHASAFSHLIYAFLVSCYDPDQWLLIGMPECWFCQFFLT